MTDTEAPLQLAGGGVERIVGSTDDRGILAALRESGGAWEPHLQRFMFDHVASDAVCMDVGANIGVHTVQLGRLAHAGTVLAFEPGSENLSYLRRNIGPVPSVNVRAHGLYSHAGELNFVASRHHPGGSYIAGADGSGGDAAVGEGEVVGSVTVDTLDAVAEREGLTRLDFVKVDIEGSEVHFLEGGEATLRTHQPVIVLECNPIPLRRFQGLRPVRLFDALRAMYPAVGHVNDAGIPARIRSRGALEHLLARHGIVDLVAGCEFPSNRLGEIDDATRQLRFRTITARPIANVVARLRPRYTPVQCFVTSGGSTIQTPSGELHAVSGQSVVVQLRARNQTPVWLAGEAANHPMCSAYRVRDATGQLVLAQSAFVALPKPVPPGGTIELEVTIEAPETPGHYSVELTLVQKGYVWFDQLDPDARATIDLYVEATDS